MRKIDPRELLDCLDTLLGKKGGIKGESEVKRMADLMSKFSKKLVSKCIYIQILKNTDSELLVKFMAEGGWALVFQWLDESILSNNYALIREILELLLICPITLDRLKENNCPKVVKGLSKDSEVEEVKTLACKLVEKWLKFIKSGQAAISDVAMAQASAESYPKTTITVPSSKVSAVSSVPLNITSTNNDKVSNVPRKIKSGIHVVQEVSSIEENKEFGDEEEEDEEEEAEEEEEEVPPIGSLLYKITVRDGKRVLARVNTKTLTLPLSKKTSEPETDSNPVNTLILKSDPISKKFRYVAKPVSEKEKANELPEREKGEQKVDDKLRTTPVVVVKRFNIDEDKISEYNSVDKVKKKDEKKDREKSKSKSSDSDDRSKAKVEKKDRDKSKSKSDSVEKSKSRDERKDRDKSKSKSDSSKDKHKEKSRSHDKEKDKEKPKDGKTAEKSLSAAEKAQIQADKDKDTLERLKTPAISILGKIPKKQSSLSNPPPSSSEMPKSTLQKTSDTSQSGDKVKSSGDSKKNIDSRTSRDRPKTVKTFNSKFRSTGLEEEIKPPPARSVIKKKIEEKRPLLKPEKHASAMPKEEQPQEKKSKISDILTDFKKDKIVDKPGAIKLIPPKPKPALLESDMFSDALTASTKFEPRKRKRRISNSKDALEVKKEIKEENTQELASPKDVKPNLKFYRDTLEDDEDKSKDNASEVKAVTKTESDSEDTSKTSSVEPTSKLYPNGVLVYKARKGPKKSVKWKEESDLTTIKYFELDENERVNVTRNFVDMKLMERSHEREAFQLARKLASEDIMEERIPWGPLYEVDIPPERRTPVEPGKASLEKSVQYAREKTVLQAIYFHRNSIPDSPAEPDPEIHPTTDPKIIPLDDITGNSDSIANFQNTPWPEPKTALIPSSPPQQGQQQQQQSQVQLSLQQPGQNQGFGPGYSTVGNFPGYPGMGLPGMMQPGQGTWRPGDSKDMTMNMNFQANGPMVPQMNQPPNMFNPHGPENFNMNGPPMGNFAGGYPMNCEPNMYGPPMNMGGPPPPQWNRGWQGGGGGRGHFMHNNMSPKFQKGTCHHFAKFGYCARGNTCRFMHPN